MAVCRGAGDAGRACLGDVACAAAHRPRPCDLGRRSWWRCSPELAWCCRSTCLKVVIAATLVTLGIYRLWRHRHPRFGGMQVGFRDLTIWSFLMASAHGAGLMVVPFVIDTEDSVSRSRPQHAHHAAYRDGQALRGPMPRPSDSTRCPICSCPRSSRGSSTASWASPSCASPGSTWTGCGPEPLCHRRHRRPELTRRSPSRPDPGLAQA